MDKPRGIRNNNPLNIRKGNNWKGEKAHQTDSSFEQFSSMEMGIRAGFVLLKRYMSGFEGKVKPRNNVQLIISRWAPPLENLTDKYVQHVATSMGVSPYETFQFSDRRKMVDLVAAMIQVECGTQVERSIIESAYDLV